MSIIKADFRLRRNDFSLNINCEIDTPITGIFGPSGAGKTSFLHVLAGLAKPDEGVLLINDKEVYNSDKKIKELQTQVSEQEKAIETVKEKSKNITDVANSLHILPNGYSRAGKSIKP